MDPVYLLVRAPSAPKVPGAGGAHSRSSSSLSAYHDNDSASRTRPTSTVPSRASSRVSYVTPRANSNNTSSYSSQASESSAVSTTSNTSLDDSRAASPRRVVRRLSSLQAPTIAPRPNRSAMLRAAKMEADAAKPKSPWANASKR